MSELHSFISIVKGSKGDAAVLLITFLLTVLVDLTIAIEIGMILAAFLFMRQVMQYSSVQQIGAAEETANDDLYKEYALPKGVQVLEINGPLFFGAAYKFMEAVKLIEGPPAVLIIRMRNVPIIDATGIRILKEVSHDMKTKGAKLILSEVAAPQLIKELKKSRLSFQIGKANVTDTFEQALHRADAVLSGT
jgi:SulP family sulfate permease